MKSKQLLQEFPELEAQINLNRIEADNKYYSKISNGWSKALKSAFDSMPNFPIE